MYRALKKGGMTADTKETKPTYIDAKSVAKHTVWLAKSKAEKKESATVSPDGDGVFLIAKQMDCTNQDIVGANCACYDAGKLALTDGDKMKAWYGLNTMLSCSMLN